MVAERLEKKGLRGAIFCNENLPQGLIGDFSHLRQILINFLTNACKYTEKGNVDFFILGSVSGAEAKLIFSVKDTGIGIKEENLLRINDKIDELELQVEPLKRQSETAKKYLVLRDELRLREISVWMATLEKLRSQAEAISRDYENAVRDLDNANRSLEALYASSGNISERMRQKDVEAESARARLSQTEGRAAECDSEAAGLKAGIASSIEAAERMKKDIAEAETRVGEIKAQIEENNATIAKVEATLRELDEKLKANNNVLDGARMKLSSRETAAEQLREKVNRLSVDCRSMDARIHMLSEMEKEYEGFSKAVKTVMRESARGNISGVHGPVANLVKADNECALAIETALGAAMQNIVIDTQNDGRKAIEMLKRLDSGRATFLPV